MNKYYAGFTEPIKRYQKSESYKAYRRKYEAGYRQEHKIMVNYLSWKWSVRNHGKRVTMQREMDYLLRRFLK